MTFANTLPRLISFVIYTYESNKSHKTCKTFRRRKEFYFTFEYLKIAQFIYLLNLEFYQNATSTIILFYSKKNNYFPDEMYFFLYISFKKLYNFVSELISAYLGRNVRWYDAEQQLFLLFFFAFQFNSGLDACPSAREHYSIGFVRHKLVIPTSGAGRQQ